MTLISIAMKLLNEATSLDFRLAERGAPQQLLKRNVTRRNRRFKKVLILLQEPPSFDASNPEPVNFDEILDNELQKIIIKQQLTGSSDYDTKALPLNFKVSWACLPFFMKSEQ